MPARKREVSDPQRDERYARGDDRGRFTEDQVDIGPSLERDRRQHATTVADPGQRDRGDRRTPDR